MNIDPDFDLKLQRLGEKLSPSPGFTDRVIESLPAPGKARRQFAIPWWYSVAALMVLSAGAALLFEKERNEVRPPHSEEQQVAYQRTSSQWEATLQRPMIAPGERPAWEYRKQLFERVQLFDPASHATLEKIVPRDGTTLIVLENY